LISSGIMDSVVVSRLEMAFDLFQKWERHVARIKKGKPRNHISVARLPSSIIIK
jgi:hypothetical protein